MAEFFEILNLIILTMILQTTLSILLILVAIYFGWRLWCKRIRNREYFEIMAKLETLQDYAFFFIERTRDLIVRIDEADGVELTRLQEEYANLQERFQLEVEFPSIEIKNEMRAFHAKWGVCLEAMLPIGGFCEADEADWGENTDHDDSDDWWKKA